MRGAEHLNRMRRLSFALAALSLAACAEAGVDGTPGGSDDGMEQDADVDAASEDALVAADAGPDAPPVPQLDASPTTGGAKVALVTPESVVVAHGHAATVTVIIDRPAGEEGEAVVLAHDGGANLEMPNHVVVQPGLTSAMFEVTGSAIGGPFTITATLGGAKTASARVLPAMTGVSSSGGDLVVGGAGLYTVALEAAAPIAFDVVLASAASADVGVPAKISIPAGQTAASFAVNGLHLSGPVAVNATFGGQTVSAKVRVGGLFLSEILYDTASEDDKKEWIELYNASTQEIDLGGLVVESANMMAADPYKPSLALSGKVAPGGCVVVGGPTVVSGFIYLHAADFNPDLGNVGSNGNADGVQLVTASGGIVDNVIYGTSNGDQLTDENGVVAPMPDVADTLMPDQSIERIAPGLGGAWQVQAVPTPGNCSPIAP
jgi:hypothetical protein